MERAALPPAIRAQTASIMERLPIELVGGILLRLPLDQPECLARAAAVCKPWRSLLRGPAFLRRYPAFHRTPRVLGFFHNEIELDSYRPLFVPTTTVRRRRVLDRRRALRQRHLDCHGGPFTVAYVVTDDGDDIHGGLRACAYSLVTKAWSEVIFLVHLGACLDMKSSVLVGDILYFICDAPNVLKYDMGRQELAVIEGPLDFRNKILRSVVLMIAEGGGLGFAGTREYEIRLWSREEEDANGVGQWTMCRVIQLETMLPVDAMTTLHVVIGFAEGVSVIFIRTYDGIFTIELKSRRINKVSSNGRIHRVIPYMSFHSPDFFRKRNLRWCCYFCTKMSATMPL